MTHFFNGTESNKGMINLLKKGITASVVLVFLGVSMKGGAVAKPKAVKRFAVVDMQTVILSVSEGKDARKKLEKQIKRFGNKDI